VVVRWFDEKELESWASCRQGALVFGCSGEIDD